MPPPPKPAKPIVTNVTHQSLELNWAASTALLSANRLKAEAEMRRDDATSATARWQVVYRGFATSCVCAGLESGAAYQARLRLSCDDSGGWGDFSDAAAAVTSRRPFSSEDLHRLVRRQDGERLLRLLEAREVCVDAPDGRGFSGLQLAAMADQAVTCELLVSFGAGVDWCGASGQTALMLAACRGSTACLQLLLAAGASVRARDRHGATALHHAVDGESLEAVRCLLAAGACPLARDAAGCDPLVRCARLRANGSAEIATVLISAGARVDCQDRQGQTALFHCCLNSHRRMAETLLRAGAAPNAINANGVSALSVAKRLDDSREMRDLLARFLRPSGEAKD